MNPWMLQAAGLLEAASARNADPAVHPWLLESAAKEWGGMPGCTTHPQGHEKTLIPVNAPGLENTSLWGFDATQYENTPGYCMGDDDVSRTLMVRGQWEPVESRMFYNVLARTPGEVIDFGAQIGWYTIMAARMGRDVLAIEPVLEHRTLIDMNARTHDVADRVVISGAWIDVGSPHLSVDGAPDIAIVKIDLEGNDISAIRLLNDLIVARKIAHVLCEISPVFNDSYGALIERMFTAGYEACVCNPWQPFTVDETAKVLAQAPQVDMMFTRKVQ